MFTVLLLAGAVTPSDRGGGSTSACQWRQTHESRQWRSWISRQHSPQWPLSMASQTPVSNSAAADPAPLPSPAVHEAECMGTVRHTNPNSLTHVTVTGCTLRWGFQGPGLRMLLASERGSKLFKSFSSVCTGDWCRVSQLQVNIEWKQFRGAPVCFRVASPMGGQPSTL